MNEEIYNKVKELLIKEKFPENKAWIEVDEDDDLRRPWSSNNNFRIRIKGNFIWWEFLNNISKIPDVYIQNLEMHKLNNEIIITIHCLVIKKEN